MFVTILLVAAGLVLVVLGADFLVDGASAIARRAKVSEFVIGLTIVGFGTSCPELVVSVTGAIEGISDIAIGNVVGSNIFNTLLILGLTALLTPVAITRQNIRRDIPITFGVTLMLALVGMKHTLFGIGTDGLGRIWGIVFLVVFAAYMIYSFRSDTPEETTSDEPVPGVAKAILLTLAGLAMLVLGGRLFVDNSVKIAHLLGVSDKFIAITLLATGTSLPELATSIVAAAKHKSQMALGNILGSNVFNILLILGTSAVIKPLDFAGMNLVDMGILVLSALLTFTSAYTGKRNLIDRFDGALMLLCEAAYMVWLFATI